MSITIAASAAFLIVLAVLPFFLAAWLLISKMAEEAKKDAETYPDFESDDWWNNQ